MSNDEVNHKMKKKKLKISRVIITVLIIAIVSLGAVFAYKALSGSKEIEEPQKQEEEVKEEKKVQIIDVNSNTRPYGIMINCHNDALPQSGLKDAYMVYEIMVEYGITRMFALFKDVDFTKVGSIRSVRNQYIAYAYENDAIIVHAGGSTEAENRLARDGINHIDVDGKYGQRDRELAKKRAWEHTLFTSSTLLTSATNNMKLRTTTDTKPLLTYSADELDLSKYQTIPANKVTIKYSNYRTSSYDYDINTMKYLRNIGNKKNTDLVTGEQYAVKNIIVYDVKYTTYSDHGYSGYQRLSNTGTGEGYYITNGVALPITWSKADEKVEPFIKLRKLMKS